MITATACLGAIGLLDRGTGFAVGAIEADTDRITAEVLVEGLAVEYRSMPGDVTAAAGRPRLSPVAAAFIFSPGRGGRRARARRRGKGAPGA